MKKYFCTLFVACLYTITIAQNIPVDFEANGNGANWTWTVFENDSDPALEIIDNPDKSGINTSSTVAKFTALQSGAPFAGCETMHGADIGTFTINEDNAIIRIMVWKPVISNVGIKLVEPGNGSFGEIKIANTLVNQWEQIEFDFTSHIGMTYDQIVVFPDFNGRSSDNIIYFDNIYGDVAVATNTSDLEANSLTLFPNPATNSLTINTDMPISNYEIYSLSGKLFAASDNVEQTNIDITHLPQGIYVLKATSNGDVLLEKFLKQ